MLRWIIDRCENRVGAHDSAIGHLPELSDIDLQGLDVSADTLSALLAVDTDQWRTEIAAIEDYLESYGDRLPEELREQCRAIAAELGINELVLQSSTA